MKRILSLGIIALFLFGGCDKDTKGVKSYVRIMSIWEAVELSESIFIGKIVDVDSEPYTKEFGHDETYFNRGFVKIIAEVEEVLQGEYQTNTTVSEEIPVRFLDFAEKGCKYVIFSKAYSKNAAISSGQIDYNPYWIMKINDEIMEIPDWDRLVSNGYQVAGQKPVSLDDLRDTIRLVNLQGTSDWCPCSLTSEQRENWRTDKSRNPQDLVCQKHNKDFRNEG